MSLRTKLAREGAGAQRGKSMSKFSRGLVAVGLLVALMFGMSPAKAIEPMPTLDHTVLCSPEDPEFFHLNIDNPYFPLLPGQVSVFLDDSDPEERVGLRIEVLKLLRRPSGSTPTVTARSTKART
jgi:hypothetical protein